MPPSANAELKKLGVGLPFRGPFGPIPPTNILGPHPVVVVIMACVFLIPRGIARSRVVIQSIPVLVTGSFTADRGVSSAHGLDLICPAGILL